MGLAAFMPQGASQLISVTTTASTAMALAIPTMGVRIYASAPVFFAFGSTAGSSGMSASIPTTSATANGVALASASVSFFNIGPNAYLSFISTAAGPTAVYVTPGYGV